MAWIDRDAIITALDGGGLPASGGERRIVRIAASAAWGWSPPPSATPPGSACEPQPGRRGGARPLLQFLDDWLATDHGPVNEALDSLHQLRSPTEPNRSATTSPVSRSY
jgi:hypothetical protein